LGKGAKFGYCIVAVLACRWEIVICVFYVCFAIVMTNENGEAKTKEFLSDKGNQVARLI
jgi:hypothetical protein